MGFGNANNTNRGGNRGGSSAGHEQPKTSGIAWIDEQFAAQRKERRQGTSSPKETKSAQSVTPTSPLVQPELQSGPEQAVGLAHHVKKDHASSPPAKTPRPRSPTVDVIASDGGHRRTVVTTPPRSRSPAFNATAHRSVTPPKRTKLMINQQNAVEHLSDIEQAAAAAAAAAGNTRSKSPSPVSTAVLKEKGKSERTEKSGAGTIISPQAPSSTEQVPVSTPKRVHYGTLGPVVFADTAGTKSASKEAITTPPPPPLYSASQQNDSKEIESYENHSGAMGVKSSKGEEKKQEESDACLKEEIKTNSEEPNHSNAEDAGVSPTAITTKKVIVSYEDDAEKLSKYFHLLQDRSTSGCKQHGGSHIWYNFMCLLEHFYKQDPKRCQRSCERQRDITQRTYLHVVCMNNPPVQVVRFLLKVSTRSLFLVDYFGLTPLHIACNYTASYEVQQCLVEAARRQQHQNKHRDDNTVSLLDTLDHFGRVPLHYALDPIAVDQGSATGFQSRRGTKLQQRVEHLQIKLEEYRQSVIGGHNHHGGDNGNHTEAFNVDVSNINKRYSWNQNLLDMSRPVDEGWGLSIEQTRRNVARQRNFRRIVELLSTPHNVFRKDDFDKSPFRLFCRIASACLAFRKIDDDYDEGSRTNVNDSITTAILMTSSVDEEDDNEDNDGLYHNMVPKRSNFDNVCYILKILLDRCPPNSNDVLVEELRHLPYRLLDVANKHPLVHSVVNRKTTHSVFATIFLLDLVIQLMLIIGFTFIVTEITWVSGDVPSSQRQQGRNKSPLEYHSILVWLDVALVISIIRQGLEIVASIRRSNFRAWCINFWNLLNVANALLVTAAIGRVTQVGGIVRTDDGTYYLILFAVGIQWVALITNLRTAYLPFCIFVTGTLEVARSLYSFVVISFFILGSFASMFFLIAEDECKALNGDIGFLKNSCSYGHFLLAMFAGYLGPGVPASAFSAKSGDIVWITVVFCIVCIMILLNVLIAVVVEAYTTNAKPLGEQMFWRFRFEGIANAEAIGGIVDREGSAAQAVRTFKERLDTNWSKCLWYFESSIPSYAFPKYRRLSIVLYGFKRTFIFIFLILWFLVGLVTLGILWPPRVIRFLFCPSVTRSEIDRIVMAEKKSLRQQQQQKQQYEDVIARMEQMEDNSVELRSIQLRLSKDLRQCRKDFTSDMKYVTQQLNTDMTLVTQQLKDIQKQLRTIQMQMQNK